MDVCSTRVYSIMTNEPASNRPVPRDGTVVVIIVNYNGGDHILECLRSLKRQTYANYRVVVVDNLSTDGSLEAVRTDFPSVTVIENGYNAGWGIACNMGRQACWYRLMTRRPLQMGLFPSSQTRIWLRAWENKDTNKQ